MPGLILLGVSFAFTGVTTITSTSMLMDAIDYAEHKLGFRGEGVVFSMNTFLNKLSATISKGMLGAALGAIEEVRALADELGELIGLSPAVLAPVLKTVGIAILTRIAAELCRDAGEGGIAAAAETAGAAAAVLTALPLLRAVLSTITGLL